ncbi:hypothetical protein Agub_g1800 [Astrephomene gubernaculifera]|uniref:Uncharacterized protein n=1 Tax=Astrephomene gubernaculifera TaxID=47775 RepID=A0AAD3HI78_9CHLO|nr:hypothetical protein Agub_g1800 [Astrephomene gubernaculifera]
MQGATMVAAAGTRSAPRRSEDAPDLCDVTTQHPSSSCTARAGASEHPTSIVAFPLDNTAPPAAALADRRQHPADTRFGGQAVDDSQSCGKAVSDAAITQAEAGLPSTSAAAANTADGGGVATSSHAEQLAAALQELRSRVERLEADRAACETAARAEAGHARARLHALRLAGDGGCPAGRAPFEELHAGAVQAPAASSVVVELADVLACMHSRAGEHGPAASAEAEAKADDSALDAVEEQQARLLQLQAEISSLSQRIAKQAAAHEARVSELVASVRQQSEQQGDLHALVATKLSATAAVESKLGELSCDMVVLRAAQEELMERQQRHEAAAEELGLQLRALSEELMQQRERAHVACTGTSLGACATVACTAAGVSAQQDDQDAEASAVRTHSGSGTGSPGASCTAPLEPSAALVTAGGPPMAEATEAREGGVAAWVGEELAALRAELRRLADVVAARQERAASVKSSFDVSLAAAPGGDGSCECVAGMRPKLPAGAGQEQGQEQEHACMHASAPVIGSAEAFPEGLLRELVSQQQQLAAEVAELQAVLREHAAPHAVFVDATGDVYPAAAQEAQQAGCRQAVAAAAQPHPDVHGSSPPSMYKTLRDGAAMRVAESGDRLEEPSSLEQSVRSALHSGEDGGGGALKSLAALQHQGAGARDVGVNEDTDCNEQSDVKEPSRSARSGCALASSDDGAGVVAVVREVESCQPYGDGREADGGGAKATRPPSRLLHLYALLSESVMERFSTMEQALLRIARQVDKLQRELKRYTEAERGGGSDTLVAYMGDPSAGKLVSVDGAMARAAKRMTRKQHSVTFSDG